MKQFRQTLVATTLAVKTQDSVAPEGRHSSHASSESRSNIEGQAIDDDDGDDSASDGNISDSGSTATHVEQF